MKGLTVFEDAGALAGAAAARFIEAGQKVLKSGRLFKVAVSGGRGPLGMFQSLLERSSELDWSRVEFYWVDERFVPESDPDSNFGAALSLFLSKLPKAASSLYPMDTSKASPEEAALAYESLLSSKFGSGPFFDLCLLGMGPDGHTASLFPGSPALEEKKRLCLATAHPASGQPRLTLTLPVLNACQRVIFILSGEDKAAALAQALQPLEGAAKLPAARVKPTNGELEWLADKAAAPNF